MRCRFTLVILAALAASMAITEVLPPPDDAAESALLQAVNALRAGDFNADFNGIQGAGTTRAEFPPRAADLQRIAGGALRGEGRYTADPRIQGLLNEYRLRLHNAEVNPGPN